MVLPKFLCNIRKFFWIILDQKLFTTTYTTDENLTLRPSFEKFTRRFSRLRMGTIREWSSLWMMTWIPKLSLNYTRSILMQDKFEVIIFPSQSLINPRYHIYISVSPFSIPLKPTKNQCSSRSTVQTFFKKVQIYNKLHLQLNGGVSQEENLCHSVQPLTIHTSFVVALFSLILAHSEQMS